ncbi:hypothetical protein HpDR98_12260 [Helicobacter pylori]
MGIGKKKKIKPLPTKKRKFKKEISLNKEFKNKEFKTKGSKKRGFKKETPKKTPKKN